MPRIFRIAGNIIDATTHKGVPDLVVEAWDRDAAEHVRFASAVTDRRGRFQLAIDEAVLGTPMPVVLPDVHLKVFRDRQPVPVTGDVLLHGVTSLDSRVMLQAQLGTQSPEKRDRITSARVFSVVEFLQLSDFKGVWREGVDKAGGFGGIVLDAVREKISKMELKPLKPSEHRTKDVLRQDVPTSRRRLENRGVTVKEVKPYRAALSSETTGLIKGYPAKLRAGDTVNLYEEDGVVRAYSIVKSPKATDINAGDVTRIDHEVRTLRSEVTTLATVRNDLADVRASSLNTTSRLDQEVAGVKTRLATVDTLTRELTVVKEESARKDETIAALRQEVTTVRRAHAEFVEKVSPERIARMEEAIRRLEHH